MNSDYSHIYDAEYSIARHLILYPQDTIDYVTVGADDFVLKSVGNIVGAAKGMAVKDVDRLDTATLAKNSGEPLTAIEMILEHKTTGNDVAAWNNLVAEMALDKNLKLVTHDICSRDMPPRDKAHDILSKVQSMLDGSVQVSDYDIRDGLDRTYRAIESAAMDDKLPGVTTNLRAIDEATGGLPLKVVTFIGARTSVGKTSLALDMLLGAARNGLPGIFVTLEDSEENIYRRLIAKESQVDLMKLKTGRLTKDDFYLLPLATDRIADLPITVVDKSFPNAEAMKAAVRTIARKKKAKLVIIDYIQITRSAKRHGTRNDELDYVVGHLMKDLAKETDSAVVLISQLRRTEKEDDRPYKGLLRDSGSMEQHAHVILMPHRKKSLRPDTDGTLLTELIVDKNKDGPTGIFYLDFIPHSATYIDVPGSKLIGRD